MIPTLLDAFAKCRLGAYPLSRLFIRAGGYDRANPSRMNDRAPAPLREQHVDERVQQERPCRILFVRNVNVSPFPAAE